MPLDAGRHPVDIFKRTTAMASFEGLRTSAELTRLAGEAERLRAELVEVKRVDQQELDKLWTHAGEQPCPNLRMNAVTAA